ncbi:TetR/AcrR family transcriptional regulator [Clavibacter michiganensis subsp. phaseoli]|uniref:TetR/AcrR family transcriptional regulator n=1 Tax=Clavibacter phaseoli TaxID=1734031 RepID=UPI001FB3E417|nr:TetR/AcrR family transcriptional regulator [Clavibacter phaseoli]MCJ1712408.1 TetR/AcrR family transcriptional regulator [Clavibacter phaseoli]
MPSSSSPAAPRRVRADAQQNLAALVVAARRVFERTGVDAPAREIAAEAGVGVGTLYRHFPDRASLVAAVFTSEIDAAADAAGELLTTHAPGEALDLWITRFTSFVATKQGMSSALRSGDPAYDALPGHLHGRLGPALRSLLDAAERAGEVRPGVDALELLQAIGDLSHRAPSPDGRPNAMVRLLVDGLRVR